MASVTLIKKTPAGSPGNFNYEYRCTCRDNKTHTITVTTANDNQARHLAQQECDEKCSGG